MTRLGDLEVGAGAGALRQRWAALESGPASTLAAASTILERKGDRPLLITAPHGGWQMREGRPKPPDRATASLALALAEAVGCRAVAAVGAQPGDPNREVGEGAFRQRCAQLRGRTVIDIHGMRDSHGFDICIGLGPSPDAHTRAAARRWCEVARRLGLRATVDSPFDARHPGTITAWAQARGMRALQIEIAAQWRRPDAAGDTLLRWLLQVAGEAAAWPPPPTMTA